MPAVQQPAAAGMHVTFMAVLAVMDFPDGGAVPELVRHEAPFMFLLCTGETIYPGRYVLPQMIITSAG